MPTRTARSELSTIATRIRSAADQLSDIASPRHDAERLVAHVLGVTWSDLWSRADQELSTDAASAIDSVVGRRASGEPLAYIVGSTVFHGLEIACGPGALVPRPETETLVDVGLALIAEADDPIVVDIGCGTGAIAIAVATSAPHARVLATDVSEEALAYARRNIAAHDVEVEVLSGDVYGALPDELRGQIDLVISNPPYVPIGASLLPRDVLAEPHVALFGGGDGCDVLKRLVDEAEQWLKPNGAIACEIGEAWQAAVFEKAFETIEVRNDHTDKPRVVWARR